jgi:hypothetical protein
MRILTNLISPLTLFTIFIIGIVAGNQDSKKAPAKTNQKQPIRNRCGFNPP